MYVTDPTTTGASSMHTDFKIASRGILCALAFLALAACSDRKPTPKPTSKTPPSAPLSAGASADPLPPEKAFPLKVEALNANTLVAQFTPAPDHYLYKSKISFALKNSTTARLGAVALPPGVSKNDPFLGEQEIYRQPVQISLPLARETGKPAQFTLVATYQGCNEIIGLCYSPIETPFEFKLP